MTNDIENTPRQQAWVVFSGQADIFWLRILKPGFRHCSVLLHDGAHWVTFDPLSNYTDIVVHNVPQDFDLPLWLRDRGHSVVPAHLDRPSCPAPFALFSCVESVKRVLGLRKRFIITPWQLFKYLNKKASQPASDIQTEILSNTQKGDLAWEV